MAEEWQVTISNQAEAMATLRRQAAETVVRRLTRAAVEGPDVARRRTEQAGIVSGQRSAARQNLGGGTPYHDSFTFQVIGGPDFPITLEGRNSHGAAHILEGGQGAHDINAVSAKRLKFPAQKGPYNQALNSPPYVFTKKVHHPLVKGYHVLRDTMREIMRRAR